MVRVLRVTQITQGCCRSGGKKFRLVSFETESGQSPVHPLSVGGGKWKYPKCCRMPHREIISL